jgi:hypothetical protein
LANLVILDMSGRILYKKPNINLNNPVSISQLPIGIYTLQVTDKLGVSYRAQFIKN